MKRLNGICFGLVILMLSAIATDASVISARVMPAQLPPARPGTRETLAVVIRSNTATSARVTLRAPDGFIVSPEARNVYLPASHDIAAFFTLTYKRSSQPNATLKVIANGRQVASVKIGDCYSLDAVVWKSRFDSDKVGKSQGWMKPKFDDSEWSTCRLPSTWNDIGITYLRTRLYIPGSWKGKPITLNLRAVDDNDVCYWNGVEIGRTYGWDKQRRYTVKPELIHFGADNLLCVAVDNTCAGGGINQSPNYLGVSAPKSLAERRPTLARPTPLGKPLPFRPMRVDNGVLRYEDGGEVVLWGVNYYPQSWHQFDNMKRLGVDMKKAIRDDLDDMKRIGVQVIRIHVFDREISDANGNLIDNEHLDILDYLIHEASKRGIYFFFTPIAWWGGPNENPDSFSHRTPKEYLYCDDAAIAASANYIRNWLNHTNRYTGYKYKDEPAICVFEIINEPAYADYRLMTDPEASYYEKIDPATLAPFKKRLRAKWNTWCKKHGIADEPRFFPLFRYELMSHYLATMHKAFRDAGAKQPVACALYDSKGHDDLIQAIADSPCEAVTTGAYIGAGGWDTDSDGVNLLPQLANRTLDPRLDKKARLVYEFDAIRTLDSYIYPACARYFRNMGVQVCCMFQYDSRATAQWNTDWPQHYLNTHYTPAKAVSFWIGGEAFREIKRGAVYATVGATQFFGSFAVSFDRNMSVYSDGIVYGCTAPNKGWIPLRTPAAPKTVMAVGDSPYAAYSGTGMYLLEIDYSNKCAKLILHPDAVKVGDPWRPSAEKPAVVLVNESHPFTFTLNGIELHSVTRIDDSDGQGHEVEVQNNTFLATPGTYFVMW